MKTRHITPFVEYPLIAAWVFVTSVGAALMLTGVLAYVAGVLFGLIGFNVLIWFFRGERLWITSHHTLPFTFMWKPRRYSMSSSLKGDMGGNSKRVDCASCDSEFEVTIDHFRSDNAHYCPTCSRVGEIVMNNYRDWFDTTEDVRQTAD